MNVAQHASSANASENQPSPVSVLEPPFDDEDKTTLTESPRTTKQDQLGIQLSTSLFFLKKLSAKLHLVPSSNHFDFFLFIGGTQVPTQPKSNLIDKSPPIGTIARTLSWGDSCADVSTTSTSEPLSVTEGFENRENWFPLVQRLFSLAGLGGEVDYDSVFSRWHSYESPLEPSLRDKYANLEDNEPLHEAKQRRNISNWKLVFDCANAALVEISGYGFEQSLRNIACGGTQRKVLKERSPMLAELVWAHMKGWFGDEPMCIPDYDGDINSLVVERLLRKDVVGGDWTANLRLERDIIIGKEIEKDLLDELFEDAVVDLTDGLR